MFVERIDSLSDLIAFGVAPAMIGFGMNIDRWFYIPVYALFVLCALIRLAYFDVTEEIRMEDENCGKRKFYEGLPVTNVAFILPIFYLIATMFASTSLGYSLTMVIGYLSLAIAFVMPFKLRKIGVKGVLILMLAVGVLLGGLLAINLMV